MPRMRQEPPLRPRPVGAHEAGRPEALGARVLARLLCPRLHLQPGTALRAVPSGPPPSEPLARVGRDALLPDATPVPVPLSSAPSFVNRTTVPPRVARGPSFG